MPEQDKSKSVYATLSKIDVKSFLEKKGKLDYLSWAKAWGLVKQAYPDAAYTITEFPEYILTNDGWVATGRDVDYRQTSAGYEVEAVVTIEEQKYSSKLFVMDYRNKPLQRATYFDINKTQQRALVKALAIAGLGLSVYAGEDLPDPEDGKSQSQPNRRATQRQQPATKKQTPPTKTFTDKELIDYTITDKHGEVKLVQVVSEAVAGNQESKATLHSLGGESKQAYAQIYKQQLYKKWLENSKGGA